jgi:hypothetical protein
MAYKFQVGEAIYSGSAKFEELVEAAGGFKPTVDDTAAAVADDSFYFQDADGAMKRESMADYATAIAGDGLAASSGVLAVGVDDTTLELNSDALRLKDNGVTLAKMAGLAAANFILGDSNGDPAAVAMSGDATMSNAGVLSIGATKVTDTMMNDDVATGLAGVGLSAASGVLAIDASELSDAAVASGDKFLFQDVTDDSTKKESIDDIAALLAGAGLAASSAVLSVQVSGAVKVASDKLGISGSFAGAGLTYAGGDDSISSIYIGDIANGGISVLPEGLKLDLNGLSAGVVSVANDSIAIVDADDNLSKKESIADLMTAAAGAGLAASSGVLAVGVDDAGIEINSDALRLKDNGVTLAKMAGIARGSIISGDASGDPQALSVGSVHQFLQSDGTDLAYVSMSGDATLAAGVLSIGATKVTDAMMNDDVATGLAGDGLSADSGVLSTKMTVNGQGDADYTAIFGVNFNTTIYTQARTVTLPSAASGDVGRKVVVKATNAGTYPLGVARAGSDVIDGDLTSLLIESNNGAVTLICAGAGNWIIV